MNVLLISEVKNMTNKMKVLSRIILSVVLFFLHAAPSVAQQVTVEAARQKAMAFLGKRKPMESGTHRMPLKSPQLQIAAKKKEFYIFNDAANMCYVVISGDERLPEVLAYSYDGPIDTENIPYNLQAVLDDYAKQIAWLQKHPDYQLSSTTNTPTTAIQPLLGKTKWNQDYPFNMLCPVINEESAPTGCGAVALAQVMYYYKWPTDYTSTIPGYITYNRTYDELPPIQFSWDNMLESYNGKNTNEQEKAVAELMLYCGHAAETVYRTSGSSTDCSVFPMALRLLGYPESVQYRSRNSYSLEQWEDLIYNELAAERPVIYSARNEYESKGTGHAFVCDGYDGNGMYHINWGWGGIGNGYYRLNILNPYKDVGFTLGYGGFSLKHEAIVGICPQKIDDVDVFSCLNIDWLYLAENCDYDEIQTKTCEYDKSKGLSDFCVLYRYGMFLPYLMYNSGNFDVGLGLYKDDQLIDVIEIDSAVESSWTYSWWSLDGLGKNLSDGNYLLKGVGRKCGTSLWLKNIHADDLYIAFEIEGGKVVGRSIEVRATQYRTIGVEQILDDGNKNPSIKNLRATFRNINNVEDAPYLYLYVDGKETNCEQAFIPLGETGYVDFVFEAQNRYHKLLITNGEYDLSGNNVLYLNHEFLIEDRPTENMDPTKAGVIRVVPEMLDFKTVIYGQSQTKKITVTNVGDVNISFSITGDKPFVVVEEGDKQFVLEPTKSMTFDVTFAPTPYMEAVEGKVNINSNALNGIQFVMIKGEGCDYKKPEAIDMGLPSGTKWASFNLGANKEEDSGDYFAWGEIKPKDSYERSNYLYYNASYNTFQDLGKDICGTKYDVANSRWDGEWQMPSQDQIDELINNSTCEKTNVNGVDGVRFISKINGATLFMPTAGLRKGNDLTSKEEGYYWSGTQSESSYVYYLGLKNGRAFLYYGYDDDGLYYGFNDDGRYQGFSVRPVINSNVNIINNMIIHEESSHPIYNLQGMKVAESENYISNLKPGLYVTNGKKLLIR